METIDDIFGILGVLLLFVNCILFFKSYHSKIDSAIKFFTIYLTISFLINTVSIILARNGINNLYLSHFYFISQFIFVSLYYRQLFNNRQKKMVNAMGLLVFIVLGIQYSTNPTLYYKFNLLEIFLTSFPLVVYSIIHLYNSLSEEGKYMYINSGILMYLTTSTLIFILGNFLSDLDRQTTKNIWFLNKVLYIVYLILILLEWKKSLSQAKNR